MSAREGFVHLLLQALSVECSMLTYHCSLCLFFALPNLPSSTVALPLFSFVRHSDIQKNEFKGLTHSLRQVVVYSHTHTQMYLVPCVPFGWPPSHPSFLNKTLPPSLFLFRLFPFCIKVLDLLPFSFLSSHFYSTLLLVSLSHLIVLANFSTSPNTHLPTYLSYYYYYTHT